MAKTNEPVIVDYAQDALTLRETGTVKDDKSELSVPRSAFERIMGDHGISKETLVAFDEATKHVIGAATETSASLLKERISEESEAGRDTSKLRSTTHILTSTGAIDVTVKAKEVYKNHFAKNPDGTPMENPPSIEKFGTVDVRISTRRLVPDELAQRVSLDIEKAMKA